MIFVCATVDIQCLEYLGYITLTEMKIHSHISGASPNGKQLWIANYEYQAQGEDELSLRKNDLIEVNIFDKSIPKLKKQ